MMMMMMMIVIFKLVSFIPDLCNFLKFLLCARYCSRAGIDKTQSKTCFCKNKDLLATVMPIHLQVAYSCFPTIMGDIF